MTNSERLLPETGHKNSEKALAETGHKTFQVLQASAAAGMPSNVSKDIHHMQSKQETSRKDFCYHCGKTNNVSSICCLKGS